MCLTFVLSYYCISDFLLSTKISNDLYILIQCVKKSPECTLQKIKIPGTQNNSEQIANCIVQWFSVSGGCFCTKTELYNSVYLFGLERRCIRSYGFGLIWSEKKSYRLYLVKISNVYKLCRTQKSGYIISYANDISEGMGHYLRRESLEKAYK